MDILRMCNERINIRGYDYYKRKQVKDLKKVNDNLYTAVVRGNYDYKVEIDLNNYKKCNCSCPYNKKICKHIVAAYYEIFPEEATLYEKILKSLIKSKNKYEANKKKEYEMIYKNAVEYASSLTENEAREKLISEIVSKRYYDNYDEYDERYEEDFEVLDEIEPEIYEQLEKGAKVPKLSEFINAFEMIGDDETWINVSTAETYDRYYFDSENMNEEEIDEFLWEDGLVLLPDKYELNEYNDMLSFVDTIEDEIIQNRLFTSLKGKGAFRRFKDELIYLGLSENWYRYRDHCLREKVINWLNDNEIEYEED